MSKINKTLLMLASVIAGRLAARQNSEPLLVLPEHSWQLCEALVRQIRRARLRGWHLAARVLSMDLRHSLGGLQSEVTTLQGRLPGALEAATPPRAHDIYRDLVSLRDDFPSMDHCQNYLSVTTEAITLQGLYLGPFEIRLDLRQLGLENAASFRVIATDPHPAESRENVTHPHVMDEILCEGEGRQAIRAALAQGRLLDFFTLVASVLRHYNPESPFVELELWYGQSCSDCGGLVGEDDLYSCRRCGESVCGECEVVCCDCEESCCNSCSSVCPHCDSAYCASCLTRCDTCRMSVCPNCLDELERCPNCHEDDSQTGRQENVPAVQPHGLGQAAVSA
jgi:hypothetical protein